MDFSTVKKRNDLSSLIKPDSVCAELGVARGDFSKYLLENTKMRLLVSIDRWAGDRAHGEAEYKEAVGLLKQFGDRSKIIRHSFSDALHIFPVEFFDFIYIDGYAHEGESGAIERWWSRLKPGGIYSGHDYDKHYPLVVEAVDRFVEKHNKKLYITQEDRYNSWFFLK